MFVKYIVFVLVGILVSEQIFEIRIHYSACQQSEYVVFQIVELIFVHSLAFQPGEFNVVSLLFEQTLQFNTGSVSIILSFYPFVNVFLQ